MSAMISNFPTPATPRQDQPGPKGQFKRQINTGRDRTKRSRTARREFQDRCLKPLGHPSVATASSREHLGNFAEKGPKLDPTTLADLSPRPGCSSKWPYLVHLLSSSESIDMNSLASLDFGSTSSNPSINLKYSGPSLSISASACLVSVSTVLGSVFC